MNRKKTHISRTAEIPIQLFVAYEIQFECLTICMSVHPEFIIFFFHLVTAWPGSMAIISPLYSDNINNIQ